MIDKAKLRMMAMDKMAKDKPDLMDRLAAKKSGGDMMGEEGMVSMPVTPEERDLILTMRKKEDGEDAAEESAEGEPAGLGSLAD